MNKTMHVTVLCSLVFIALRVNILLPKRLDAPIATPPVLTKIKTMLLPCRARIVQLVGIFWTIRRRKKNTMLSPIASFAKAAPNLQQLFQIAASAVLESTKIKVTTPRPFVLLVQPGNTC